MTLDTAATAFEQYVPRLVVARHDLRDRTNCVLTGTVVFADVSGFTKLSEHLASLGKAGAEELTSILNRSFTDLLDVAFTESGDLISYGGDALLLAFDGAHHAERAVRAAIGMRSALRAQGPIATDAGTVRLRISQGVHSGDFRVIVAGTRQREAMLVGAEATRVTAIEAEAGPGDVLLSDATAALLPRRFVGRAKGSGHLARAARSAASAVPPAPRSGAGDLSAFLPAPVRRRIRTGGLDPEHRFVGVAFVQVLEVDRALADLGAEQLADRLGTIVDTVEQATRDHDTCLLATDIAPDGVKLIVTAGAPDAAEDTEGMLLATVRQVLDHDLPLPVRAGAHAGHVFAGEVGSPDRRVYTVIGDAVNLSARLMGKAAAGEVVASGALLGHAGLRFEHRELEPFMVKGKRHPQQASIVGDRIVDGSRTGWENTPFIGRRGEMQLLESAWRDARDGRGSVVDLVGGAGVGKSRLLHRFLEDVRDARVIRITSEPYQSTRPYYATRLLLRSVLGIEQSAPPESAGQQLLAALGRIDAGLVPFAPLLAMAIDAAVPTTPEVDDLAPEFRVQRLQEVFGSVLASTLTDPTVIVFEDANFVDRSSRSVLEYALRFVERGPWLVVLTRRDTEAGLSSDLDFAAQRVDLEPLDDADLRELARLVSERKPIPDDEIDEMIGRAGGNPLFLIELVQARMETDDRAVLPTTLEGIIAARLDRLAGHDRRVLRHLAVLGDRIPPELARRVLSDLVPQVTDPRTWRRLAEFVVFDQGDLRFSHGLLREVAYEGLPFVRRREVHLRFAELLQADEGPVDSLRLSLLALHFHLGGDALGAYRFGRAAGERAMANGANVEATTLLTRALDNGRRAGTIDEGELGEVAEELADAAELAARYDRATRALRIARSSNGSDPVAMARLCRKEGVVRERTGRYDAALRWYRKGRAHADRADDVAGAPQRAELLLATAGVTMHQGRLRACIRWAERALTEAVASGNRRAEAHAYYLLDVAHTDLGDTDAARYRGRSLAIFEELGDLTGMARTLGNLSVDARYEGRWDDALELAGRCSEVQQRVGDVTGLAMSRYNAAEVLQDQGRLEEAEEMLADARRTWRAASFTLGIAAATGALGRIAVRSRDDRRAVALVDEAIEMFAELGADAWVMEIRAHRVEADLFAGRWHDVLAAVPDTGDDTVTGQDAALRSKLLRFRGVAAAALGSAEDARATLRDAERLAVEAGAPYEAALARLELGRVDPDAADARSEALRTLEELGVTRVGRLVPDVTGAEAIP